MVWMGGFAAPAGSVHGAGPSRDGLRRRSRRSAIASSRRFPPPEAGRDERKPLVVRRFTQLRLAPISLAARLVSPPCPDPRDATRSVAQKDWAGNVHHASDFWLDAAMLGRVRPGIAEDTRSRSPDAELVEEPKRVLSSICQFLGVDDSDEMLGSRLRRRSILPDPGPVALWRNSSSRATCRYRARTGPLLPGHGCSPSGYRAPRSAAFGPAAPLADAAEAVPGSPRHVRRRGGDVGCARAAPAPEALKARTARDERDRTAHGRREVRPGSGRPRRHPAARHARRTRTSGRAFNDALSAQERQHPVTSFRSILRTRPRSGNPGSASTGGSMLAGASSIRACRPRSLRATDAVERSCRIVLALLAPAPSSVRTSRSPARTRGHIDVHRRGAQVGDADVAPVERAAATPDRPLQVASRRGRMRALDLTLRVRRPRRCCQDRLEAVAEVAVMNVQVQRPPEERGTRSSRSFASESARHREPAAGELRPTSRPGASGVGRRKGSGERA